MTNSKSVDNHSFMTTNFFVMMSRTYSLIDRVKFIINRVAPDFLPFIKTEPGYTRNEITSWDFICVMGCDRANLAAVSAFSLPRILTDLCSRI